MNHKPCRTDTEPDDQRQPLVLIADAHVSRKLDNDGAFFRMLSALEHGSADVIFLGDIFDLWIALPAYEDDLHRAFLAWCQRQKANRRIGFIEGNHEFFLAQTHPDMFSWCTHRPWWLDAEGHLFCHGDRINRRDRNYRLFRQLIRNPVTKYVMTLLPFGPRLAHRIKIGMQGAKQQCPKRLPFDELQRFAEARFDRGAKRIFTGHFHHAYHYRGVHGGDLFTLPDWFSQECISVLAADRCALRQGPWQDILPLP